MNEKSSPLRETDEAAIRLAKTLLGDAGFAALAVNEPETGFPLASRVLIATDTDGAPVMLADIWPSQAEIADVVGKFVTREQFTQKYADNF